jgi:hypothetical protein
MQILITHKNSNDRREQKNELQIIKYIAQRNGYKPSLIDHLYNKMLKKTPYNNSNGDTKYVSVDYCQTAEKSNYIYTFFLIIHARSIPQDCIGVYLRQYFLIKTSIADVTLCY